MNNFGYKFKFLTKKQKKITILRAPCNHKNSKEQYSIKTYKCSLQSTYAYNNLKFYHNYILLFFKNEKNTALTTLKYTLKKNE